MDLVFPIEGSRLHPMPVEERDVEATAERCGELAGSPPVRDLAPLDLETDGHTASLVPRDAQLEVANRSAALTAETSIPARRVRQNRALVLADAAAAGGTGDAGLC